MLWNNKKNQKENIGRNRRRTSRTDKNDYYSLYSFPSKRSERRLNKKMMFCKKCNKYYPSKPNFEFCPKCGNRLLKATDKVSKKTLSLDKRITKKSLTLAEGIRNQMFKSKL